MTAGLLLACCLLLLARCGQAVQTKPNVVMVLTDDLGWADVGWHRAPDYKENVTPRMNELVKTGVELDRAYAFKYCSPSRCAIQVGRNPIHVNVMNLDPSFVNYDDEVSGYSGIPRNMTGIAQVMKQGGYQTHFVGKWDVGMATPRHTPHGRGFDTSLSYFYHTNDYWNFTVDDDHNAGPESCATLEIGESIYDLWLKDKDSAEGPAIGLNNSINSCFAGNDAFPAGDIEGLCQYEDALFLRRALDIVEGYDPADNQPLFLFYAPHIAHEPLQVPEGWMTKLDFIENDDEFNDRQKYLAMVHYLDSAVGNLTDAIKASGQWNDTLVVFAADNGGPIYRNGTPGANNFPLRGGKASNWEGGIRVNSWVNGGFLPAHVLGTKLQGLVAIWDWYATFARLAGVDPTDLEAEAAGLPPIDSVDVWGYVSGQQAASPRTMMVVGAPSGWHDIWGGVKHNASVVGVIYDNRTNHSDVSQGNLWKLLVNGESMAIWTGPEFPNASTATEGTTAETVFFDCDEGCLYELDQDPTERADVASVYPQVFAELKRLAEDFNATVFSPDRGAVETLACTTAQTTYQNFWGPFLQLD